jgi:hypothetical protein
VIDLNESVRPPIQCHPVTIIDLGEGMCRWPIGDPRSAEFAYCGAPAAKSYCAGHRAIAYMPPTMTALDGPGAARSRAWSPEAIRWTARLNARPDRDARHGFTGGPENRVAE